MELDVRPCLVGEGLKDTGACFECPAGSFLLFAPVEATECTICNIDKAFCVGGKRIGPKPGFWRKSNETAVFIQCLNDACLGMDKTKPEDLDGNPTGLCDVENGYHGVICASCMPGFKRKSKFECQRCYKYEGLYIAAVLIIAVVALTLAVRAVLKSSILEDNVQSVFAKILLNHV